MIYLLQREGERKMKKFVSCTLAAILVITTGSVSSVSASSISDAEKEINELEQEQKELEDKKGELDADKDNTEEKIDENLSEQTEAEQEINAVDEKRSEEHTSELQSRGHLVCRLLLEKKKKENTKES